MHGEKYPYVVPVSFGAELIDEKIVIYFHSAKKGMKLDQLTADPYVCVEGDIFIAIEPLSDGITARYESVIGFGKCSFVEDPDEKAHGLKLLTEHYGYCDYPLDTCGGAKYVQVGRIVLEEVTGKRNLPKN